MSRIEVFREFIAQRITTAALEIFAAAEKSFAEFEEEICRSKDKSTRLQRLLDIVTQPEIKLHRTDVQHISLLEPKQIREKQEPWTSQEEEQLQGLQTETTDFMLTSISVKHDSDQEDFSECSYLDQIVKVEKREEDSLPINTTEKQIKAEPDEQDCAAPEPDIDSPPFSVVAPDVPTAQSLEEEEHGGVLLFQMKTQNNEALPMENMPQTHQTGKRIHQCQQCDKTFSRKAALVFHTRTHTVDKPYQCQHCLKRFSRKRDLVDHIRTHTGEKPYQCQHCLKRFSQKSNLVDHMRTHTGEKPYQCQHCNRQFTLKTNLVAHTRIHTGEKPFQCQQCNRQFALKTNLVTHTRNHTGDKPFQCQQCSKRFGLKGHLVAHTRIHTGEKPYQCQQCNKQFNQKSNLVGHMRTHTGEKPYKCQECRKTFSQSRALCTHMKTHRR